MTNPTLTTGWTGMIPVDDTALAATDTGGPGTPIIYLNGQFATQGYWRRVIADLGTGWRHITYDERARGTKSGRSADYSFEAAVRDVDAVLAARGVERAVVVGWSYGAFIAAHWASRNPDRAIGAVLVDGAQPYDWLTNELEVGVRKMFRRMRPLLLMARPTGLTPRMTADEMADSNIEVGRIARAAELGPVLDKITVPTTYVVASGASFGSKGDEQEQIRTSLPGVTERNPNITIHAKVPSNHSAILRKELPCGRRCRTGGCRASADQLRCLREDAGSMITIRQLAKHAGVTVRAVRHFHQIGLLTKPERDQAGYRVYDAHAVVSLIKIRTLADAGVPLVRVQGLLEAGPEEFTREVAEIDPTAASPDPSPSEQP